VTRLRYGVLSTRPSREKRRIEWILKDFHGRGHRGQFPLCTAWEISDTKEMEGRDVKNWHPVTCDEAIEACCPEPPLPAWGEGPGPWRYVRLTMIVTTSRVDYVWERLKNFLREFFGYRRGRIQLGTVGSWHQWEQEWLRR